MIDAIVLAAGRSQRMGTQKLLLPFAGQTMIGHIVDQVVAGPIRKMVVVVGANDDAVAQSLSNKAITLVKNPDPMGEMLSSVRVGLQSLAPDTSAAVIVLGDQPTIETGVIRILVEAFLRTEIGIVVPAFGGKRGHPMLVAARHFPEILSRHDGVGLRGLLEAHRDDLYELNVSDAGVLSDIDYPDDYRRELERYGTKNQTERAE